ncbi:MAG: hypothetical protein LBS81_03970 [Endomicrobium sp.]|jgi:hypothetical protein|nr:hypothetical protein [Endomicrobium sp.]
MSANAIKNYAENGALHYANRILKGSTFKKIFAFGCSGDKKHYIIKPIFVDKNGYKLLNKVDNFENFSLRNIDKYYREQVLEETPVEVRELDDILKSKELNEYLRKYGQLGDTEKPLVVSAILLALNEERNIASILKGDEITTDGQKIYNALCDCMKKVEVQPETKKKKY